MRVFRCFSSTVFPISAIFLAISSRYIDRIDEIFFFGWYYSCFSVALCSIRELVYSGRYHFLSVRSASLVTVFILILLYSLLLISYPSRCRLIWDVLILRK